MARYIATILFPDGQQLQTSTKGCDDDQVTGVLRMEAVEGMRELVGMSRYDEDEAAEVADVLNRLDDE